MPLSTIGRALAELADSWTLLILQRAFLGVRRFAGWRDALGISDSVLAGRLREMTAACLLEARPYREGGRTRSEYRLTPRGLDLWSLLVAIWWWERTWVPREVPLPELWHGAHRCPVSAGLRGVRSGGDGPRHEHRAARSPRSRARCRGCIPAGAGGRCPLIRCRRSRARPR